MPADASNFGLFACANGVQPVGSTNPYGGAITGTPLAKDGSVPDILIASENANASGGLDFTRYGAACWKNTHASSSITGVYGYLRNGSRQPASDGIITITPSVGFVVPAGYKCRLVFQKTDGTDYGEWRNFNGNSAIVSSVQCKAGKFRRLQVCDASGNPVDCIPVGSYFTVSSGITLGLLRGPRVLGEAGDTVLTAEFIIGWHTAQNATQAPANRTVAPSGVSMTDGVRMAGYDQSILIPGSDLAALSYCQQFLGVIRFAGAEPPQGTAQIRPNFSIGGNAV